LLLLFNVHSFVEDGEMKTKYKVIIGGQNFGCGSSREHAPVALGAAGEAYGV
jgi:3-isopropylmalate/(R)-2-methylmalate dehydratase small subunit